MSESSTAKQPERQELRRQLRAAGWNIGSQTKADGRLKLQLWPVSPGIEPRWVEGADKTDALRNAVRELCARPLAEEPEPPGATSE